MVKFTNPILFVQEKIYIHRQVVEQFQYLSITKQKLL